MTSYRVYYNSSADPQKWSVDEGTSDSEVTVMGFDTQGCRATGAWANGSQPRAWMIVICSRMYLRNGLAIFEP